MLTFNFRFFVVLFCAIFVFSSAAYAKDVKVVQAEYDAMIKASYKAPADYDFARLRELYKELPSYNAFKLHPQMNYKRLIEEIKKPEEKGNGGKLIHSYIQKHFAMPQAHMFISMNSKKETTAYKYHSWMGRGLMKALLGSGDGKGPETAYHVLNVSEEYLIVAPQFKQKSIVQNLEQVKGRSYDKLTGEDKETGEKRSVWFDITHVFESYDLGKKPAKSTK